MNVSISKKLKARLLTVRLQPCLIPQRLDCPRLTAEDTKGRSGLNYVLQSSTMMQKLNYNMHMHTLLMRFMICART